MFSQFSIKDSLPPNLDVAFLLDLVMELNEHNEKLLSGGVPQCVIPTQEFITPIMTIIVMDIATSSQAYTQNHVSGDPRKILTQQYSNGLP